jgi:hypothetical protein
MNIIVSYETYTSQVLGWFFREVQINFTKQISALSSYYTMRDSLHSTWNLLKYVVFDLMAHIILRFCITLLRLILTSSSTLTLLMYLPDQIHVLTETKQNLQRSIIVCLLQIHWCMELYHLTFVRLPLLCHLKLLLNKLILQTFLRGSSLTHWFSFLLFLASLCSHSDNMS